MYTEREKVRYVEMMWAEGLTPCAAQRKWGRPTREALRRWERQAERGELPAEMPRARAERAPRSHYPEATRAEAVRLYRLGEKPAHIARRLGIGNASIVRRWDARARKRAILSETGARDAPREKERKELRGMVEASGSEDEAARLRADLEEALLEVAAYKELMRDPKAAGPESLSKRRLVGLGEKLRRDSGCSLARILTFLGISKSTYHYHRARLDSPSGMPDEDFDEAVVEAFSRNGGIYGYRRLKAQLEGEGVRAPERKVREAMARLGLVAR